MSLPVCPECEGDGIRNIKHPYETGMSSSCPACGGSGVDITEAVEAAYEVLKPYLAKDMPGWVPGWQVRVARRVALAVLDKEGTSVVSGEGETP